MKTLRRYKKSQLVVALLSILFLGYGCQKEEPMPPGNLGVNHVFVTLVKHDQYLDTSTPIILVNHPNFNPNDPSTWTGEAAQYVIHKYTYDVYCHVTNAGKGTAFDAELDVGFFYDDGSEEFETYYLGNIPAYEEYKNTLEIVSYDKQLEECAAEVYWFNY
ncbi:MAG: hypothetical protein NXI10_07815 [bacterium]|nr:hypothetical protein [bacterium]